MQLLDVIYPGYGLAQHKGYPSKAHIQALESLGVSPVHRRSYAPVRRIMEQQADQSQAQAATVS
jgi:ribonuclease HII